MSKFIKDNKYELFMGPLFIIIASILSLIYHIHIEYTFYVISFFAILWVTLIVFRFIAHRKREKMLVDELLEKEAEESKEDIKWQIIREKEDFFGMWAHQIKTPIAAMKVLLQSEECDISTCKQELFMIERYVEMALNYLRFDSMSNDMVLSPCDLNQMTRQVVKKFATIFINKHLSVKLENLEYTILTDEKWFAFAMEQILSNALKYTGEGEISISSKEENGHLCITVSDTGIGIKKEDIPRLFEKGFTGYNGRMDKKASGLGLHLCKGVCDKLGHSIRIVSTEGVGTQVTLVVNCEKVNKSDLTKM